MRKKCISLVLMLGIFIFGMTSVNALEAKVTTSDELAKCIDEEGKCIIDNSLTASNVVIDAKTVTIDLNGNTLTSDIVLQNKANLTIMDSKGNGLLTHSGKTVQVLSGSKLILESGAINSGNQGVTVDSGNFVMNGGKITSQEMGVAYFNKSNITINKGTIETKDNCAMGDNGTKGWGGNTVVINGGDLISNITSAGYISCGIYNANDTTLTVKSGTKITANKDGAGIVIRGGKVTIDNQVISDMKTGISKGKVGDSKVIVSGKVVKDYDSRYPAMDTINVQINYNTVVNETGNDSLFSKQEYALNEEIKSIINENKIVELNNVDLTDISIETVVADADDTDKDEAVSKSKDLIKDFTVGKALDLSIVVNNKDSFVTAISETSNSIPFGVDVSDIANNDKLNYEFQIIRYHVDEDGKGVADVLDSEYDAENKIVTFESDKFSTYLVNYKTTEKIDNVSNPNTFDGIMISMIIGFITLIGLVGTVKVLENRR